MNLELAPDPFLRDSFRLVVDGSPTDHICTFHSSGACSLQVLSHKQLKKAVANTAKLNQLPPRDNAHIDNLLYPAWPSVAPDWLARELDFWPWSLTRWNEDPVSDRYVISRTLKITPKLDGSKRTPMLFDGHLVADREFLHVVSASHRTPTTLTEAARAMSFPAEQQPKKRWKMASFLGLAAVLDPEAIAEELLERKPKLAPPEALAQVSGWAANSRLVGGWSIPWSNIHHVYVLTDYGARATALQIYGVGRAPRFNYETQLHLVVNAEDYTMLAIDDVVDAFDSPQMPARTLCHWLARDERMAMVRMEFDSTFEPFQPLPPK